jgi:phosphoglycerate dehydrogenase-like enzyme
LTLTAEIFNEDGWPVCEGQSVRLIGRSNSDDVSFNWKVNQQDVNETDSIYDYVGNDGDEITVDVTANSGCYVDNTVTSIIETSQVDICVSVDELEAAGISVFPNPAVDVLQIQTTGNTNIELLDASGRLIKVLNINGQSTINVSEYAAGNYLLRILPEQQSVIHYNLTITK